MQTIKDGFIVGTIIWVVVFGLNVGGKHYGIDYSTSGLTLVWGK